MGSGCLRQSSFSRLSYRSEGVPPRANTTSFATSGVASASDDKFLKDHLIIEEDDIYSQRHGVPIAQLVEQESPKPQVGGSTPSRCAMSTPHFSRNGTRALLSGELTDNHVNKMHNSLR